MINRAGGQPVAGDIGAYRTVAIRRISIGREPAEALDDVAVEEPLEVRIGFGPSDARQVRSISITMRTPGRDDELAAGFLLSEGIVDSASDIHAISQVGLAWLPGETANAVQVELAEHVAVDLQRLQRHFYTTSSCGICGKASIEEVQEICTPTYTDQFHTASDVLNTLPERLRGAQEVFHRTGGLHAAALFDENGNILAVREDVGRHNALDKLIGSELLAGRVPIEGAGLLLSGRASFELIQKAAAAGLPLVAAIGAPSSLAVALAGEIGMTLIGFLRADRFNVYADPGGRLGHVSCG